MIKNMFKKHKILTAIVVGIGMMTLNFLIDLYHTNRPGSPYYEADKIMKSYMKTGIKYKPDILLVLSENEDRKYTEAMIFAMERFTALLIAAGAVLGLMGGSLLTLLIAETAGCAALMAIYFSLKYIFNVKIGSKIFEVLPWNYLPWNYGFPPELVGLSAPPDMPTHREVMFWIALITFGLGFVCMTAGWFAGGLVRMAWERLRRHEKREAA